MPAKTFELIIRDGRKVLFSTAARTDDEFAFRLIQAYRTYYPDAPDDEAVFYRFARGVFEGIMSNIVAVELSQPPEKPVPRYEIAGTTVRDIESPVDDKANDDTAVEM